MWELQIVPPSVIRSLGILGLGAAATIVQPPYEIAWAIWLVFPALTLLMDQAISNSGLWERLRRGFGLGWLFGYGYFFVGLLWLTNAYSVDPGDGWKAPLLALGFPVYLSLFYGVGFAVAGLFWSRSPWRIFAIAVAFLLGEWLRGWVLTGFPLMAIGEVLLRHAWSAKALSILGVAGANGIVPLIGALPVLLLAGRNVRLSHAGAAAVCAAAVAFTGMLASWQADDAEPADKASLASVRIVQSEFSALQKWNPEARSGNLSHLVEISNRPRSDGTYPTHVIWPEVAFAFFPEQEPAVVDQTMARLAGQPTLVVGGMRMLQQGTGFQFFNSVFAGRPGAWSAIYDKKHLIPSEEFVPWRGLFEAIGLANWIMGADDYEYSTGERSNVVGIPGGSPALIAICYEVLFADDMLSAIDQAGEKPKWMVVVSDNSWFGLTQGPVILFHQARLRAVELGLPVLQAANHGISAVINPDGSLHQVLDVGREGVIDFEIEDRPAGTFYSRNHLVVFWVVVLICLLPAALASMESYRWSGGCPSFNRQRPRQWN